MIYCKKMYQKTFGHYDVVTVGETWGANAQGLRSCIQKKNAKNYQWSFQFEHINLDKQNGKRKWI